MTLYLVAGEDSGDQRGAELMRALRERFPAVIFKGAGGPAMRALAEPGFLNWADEAVVGLWDVLKKYAYFRKVFNGMLKEIAELQPVAVIFIDYPGFNLRLASAVKQRMASIRTIFYISPQVWAWNRGRIPKMARYLDLMLCIFPFEKELYEASGLRTAFVGHPMLESLEDKRLSIVREPDLVGLFPGSRGKEVARIFPVMIAAAVLLRQSRPKIRLEAAAASSELAANMQAQLRASGLPENFCQITIRSSHELMQRAAVGLVCSGTATLEAAFFGLPLCIIYKVAWLTWAVGKRLVKVPFLGMPNVLAGREIAREFLQENATPEALAAETERLLADSAARETLQADLAQVVEGLGPTGAAARAADSILSLLGC